MVNPTKEQVTEYNKLIAIGPEFGVTLGSRFSTIIRCLRLFLKGRKYSNISFKGYLRDYLYTNIRRRPIEAYECEMKFVIIIFFMPLHYGIINLLQRILICIGASF